MAHGLELRAPFLDHRFVAAIMGLPDDARFTTPPKKLLAPALAPLADLEPLTRKKRGFNPPITGWLEGNGDLAPRLHELGARLTATTGGQLAAPRVDAFVNAWRNGEKGMSEQVLQLVILDESLGQLAARAALPRCSDSRPQRPTIRDFMSIIDPRAH
jgi:asparagine synthase (glutamine-hydrolysing)